MYRKHVSWIAVAFLAVALCRLYMSWQHDHERREVREERRQGYAPRGPRPGSGVYWRCPQGARSYEDCTWLPGGAQ
jgi:hypothetical protein